MTQNPDKPQQSPPNIKLPEAQIPQEVIRAISGLPEEKKRVIIKGIQQVQIQTIIHAGPLPPPDILAAYNTVVNNAAERIITMAEEQNKHRMKLESIIIPNREGLARRGQTCALIIGITGIAGTVICAWLNQPVIGSVLGGSTLGSIVLAFISGKSKQEKSLAQKKP